MSLLHGPYDQPNDFSWMHNPDLPNRRYRDHRKSWQSRFGAGGPHVVDEHRSAQRSWASMPQRTSDKIGIWRQYGTTGYYLANQKITLGDYGQAWEIATSLRSRYAEFLNAGLNASDNETCRVALFGIFKVERHSCGAERRCASLARGSALALQDLPSELSILEAIRAQIQQYEGSVYAFSRATNSDVPISEHEDFYECKLELQNDVVRHLFHIFTLMKGVPNPELCGYIVKYAPDYISAYEKHPMGNNRRQRNFFFDTCVKALLMLGTADGTQPDMIAYANDQLANHLDQYGGNMVFLDKLIYRETEIVGDALQHPGPLSKFDQEFLAEVISQAETAGYNNAQWHLQVACQCMRGFDPRNLDV